MMPIGFLDRGVELVTVLEKWHNLTMWHIIGDGPVQVCRSCALNGLLHTLNVGVDLSTPSIFAIRQFNYGLDKV